VTDLVSDFEEVEDFTEAIRALTALEKLDMNLGNCTMSSESFLVLANRIGSMKSLQNLKLGLNSHNEIWTTQIKAFCGALGKLALKQLDLNLWCSRSINDLGVKLLAEGIQTQQSLEKLQLRFLIAKLLTNRGLEFIYEGLKKLKLKSLDIDCPKINGISDNTLKALGDALKTMDLLECLRLDFQICVEFTSQGLANLAKGLCQLKNLRDLTIHTCRFLNLNDEGLSHIGKALHQLSKLEELQVQMPMSQFLTDEGLRVFVYYLKSLKYLDYLFLNFGSAPNVTSQSEGSLKEGFKGKSITILLR
jgi:hypothetical protein